jgi:phosphoribosylaminoimidazolecarboxamide formyltransferase/IMP cyclohydrolase
MLPARRALLSVSDKRGLADFAAGLHALGVEILSTGGTHRFLEEHGVPVLQVAEVTGFPEILDGRVKTLHPRIHGGVLADRARASHLAQLQEHGITPIDLVAVNLYPFRQTAAAPGATFSQTLEMIDVGGPCLLRAAAKNYQGVVVVVDPDDYPQILAALESGGGRVPEPVRRGLAVKAFRHTQAYDAAIAAWLGGQASPEGERFPRHLTLDLVRELELRYGENPHQQATLYRLLGGEPPLGGMRQLQGKELSYNNLLDADAARKLVGLFAEPAAAIVKHTNACGVGRGGDAAEAFTRALATDPVSAFGSIVAINRPVDRAFAEALGELFVEVLVAPAFDEGALAALAARRTLRLLAAEAYRAEPGALELRSVDGGLLAQEPDGRPDAVSGWTCATRREPSAGERRALEFAWSVARYVKSNAIVLATADQTVGIGAGQMSRVDSCRLAVEKAILPVAGTAAASDAFFPFRDGLDALAAAGVTAVVQPGGSRRDDEVIAAADEHGMAMLLTGARHFRH